MMDVDVPPDTLNEAQIIYRQLHIIQSCDDPSRKMEAIDDLEILLSEYLDDEYREDLDEVESEFEEGKAEARGPTGYDNSEIRKKLYEKKKKKWRALMEVIGRSGLKPRSAQV